MIQNVKKKNVLLVAKEFSPNQKKSRSCIYPALFILAVKSIESKAESFGGAD